MIFIVNIVFKKAVFSLKVTKEPPVNSTSIMSHKTTRYFILDLEWGSVKIVKK